MNLVFDDKKVVLLQQNSKEKIKHIFVLDEDDNEWHQIDVYWSKKYDQYLCCAHDYDIESPITLETVKDLTKKNKILWDIEHPVDTEKYQTILNTIYENSIYVDENTIYYCHINDSYFSSIIDCNSSYVEFNFDHKKREGTGASVSWGSWTSYYYDSFCCLLSYIEENWNKVKPQLIRYGLKESLSFLEFIDHFFDHRNSSLPALQDWLKDNYNAITERERSGSMWIQTLPVHYRKKQGSAYLDKCLLIKEITIGWINNFKKQKRKNT